MAIERVVAHLAAGENVGDRMADQFADALEPVARGTWAWRRNGTLRSPLRRGVTAAWG